jgi:organic radical activating enzyme
MAKWIDQITGLFSKGSPILPIQAGMYQFQSPPEDENQYRLHLRLEPSGSGLLIINAHTTLHLNQTAAEFAYYIVMGYSEEDAIKEITGRYNIHSDQAKTDYLDLVGKIQALIRTEDLEPVTYLNIDRMEPYSAELSAPYRLDCALTYRVNESASAHAAPLERVKRDLLSEEWKVILQKAWNAGIPHIVFTGGEPTTRPDLPELVAYAESIGQVTGLLTNGLRLSNREYLHELLNAGLDHIMILLDPEAEQSWEAVKDALVEDIFVTVHLTIANADESMLFPYLDRLVKMGLKNLSLSAQSEDLKPVMKESSEYASARGMSLVWDIPVPYTAFNPFNFEEESIAHITGEGNAWLYVEPDGDVLPSQGINRVMGNLLSDDWSSIWANRPVKD